MLKENQNHIKYKGDIPKVEKLLKDKDVDIILRDLIRKNEFSITKEKLDKEITMEFCIRVLKIIYSVVEIEQEYESNEVFNIKIEEIKNCRNYRDILVNITS